MILAENVTKRFDDILALDNVSAEIRNGSVFGLIGSNGAGKSTFLRLLAGILSPDTGTLAIDGETAFENLAVKRRCFYISDEQFFFPGCSPEELKNYYKAYYPGFDEGRWKQLMQAFGLDLRRKVRTFSKGMKKQVSVICGVCSGADYLFCDETFDGLDPVMRQGIKSIFAKEMEERGLTPVIASHNLRELEDICDHVGLLHKGGVLLSKDLEDMKCNIQKVQCVFSSVEDELKALNGIEVLKKEQRGSLCTITVRSTREEVEARFATVDTIFYEVLPLSLEEIFISETEVVGYDIKKLILG